MYNFHCKQNFQGQWELLTYAECSIDCSPEITQGVGSK